MAKEAATAAIKHKFEHDIETLRSELRTTEQRIDALRSGALATLSARHEVIDKRRLQAIEAVWHATTQMRRYRFLVHTMQVVKIPALVDASSSDREKLKRLGEMLFKASGIEENNPTPITSPDTERLFVPASAWTAFSALRAVNSHAVAYATMIKTGAPASLVKDSTDTAKLVKLVLPHQVPFLEEYPESGIFFLGDEIEELVFKELARAVDMPSSDRDLVVRASMIIDAADDIVSDNRIEVPENLKADAAKAAALAKELRE